MIQHPNPQTHSLLVQLQNQRDTAMMDLANAASRIRDLEARLAEALKRKAKRK